MSKHNMKGVIDIENTGYKTLMPSGEVVHYDDEGINYDDIPKITDFSKARKNPFAGKFKDGYTVVVEHEGYNEVRKYDFTQIPKTPNGKHIPVEVKIEKREKQVN